MEIIIWLLFGLATALVAKEKGRSVGLWLILGFLLGIFALLIIIFLPSVDNQLLTKK